MLSQLMQPFRHFSNLLIVGGREAATSRMLWLLWPVLLNFLVLPFLQPVPTNSILLTLMFILVGVALWWLLVPWIGWATVLLCSGICGVGLLGPWNSVRVVALVVLLQLGCILVQKAPGVLRACRWNFAFFDDRVVQVCGWLGSWHPVRPVLARHRHWPGVVQRSYDQMRVMNKALSGLGLRWHEFLKKHASVYWPLWALTVGPILLIGVVGWFFVQDDLHSEILSQVARALFLNAGPVVMWLLFFPWVGWLPIMLAFIAVPAGFYTLETDSLVLAMVLLLQKGYLCCWRPGWLRMMVNSAVIDTRIAEKGCVLTRIHPVILGARYLPRLAQTVGLPGKPVRLMWWIIMFSGSFLLIRSIWWGVTWAWTSL